MLIRGISQIIGIPWCRWCCWWCGFPDGWCRVLICMMMGFHKSWWFGFQDRDDLADEVDGWWRASICMMMGQRPVGFCCPGRPDRLTQGFTLISPTTPSFESLQAQTQNKINIKSTNTYIAHHPLFWICPTYYGHKYNTNSKAYKW